MKLTDRVVDRWARREPAIVVSVTSLVAASLVIIVSLLTLRENYTIFGPALGADYPQFYSAGTMIRDGHADRLYDLQLQQEYYHALIPNQSENSYLPFVYPPFITVPFIFLSMLPYHYSFLAWAAILIALYSTGVAMMISGTRSLNGRQKRLIMLCAIAFPPFLIESVLPGQMPPLGFFAFSLALTMQHRNNSQMSGAALALCTYKPTLMILILPLLFIAREWKVIQGFVIGCLFLATVSIAIVGLDAFAAYVQFLVRYFTLTKEGFRTFKYVDLASFVRLLAGSKSNIPSYVGFAGILAVLLLLSRTWIHQRSSDHRFGRMLWTNAMAWTLVMNVYTGIYDVTLLVLPLICMVDERALYHPAGIGIGDGDQFPRSLRAQLLLVYATCWVTQLIAVATRVQVLTLVLCWIAASQYQKLSRLKDRTMLSQNAGNGFSECRQTMAE